MRKPSDTGFSCETKQDAMFMEAESYFFDDRYIKARDSYDALVKEFTNTRYLDTIIDHEWFIANLSVLLNWGADHWDDDDPLEL